MMAPMVTVATPRISAVTNWDEYPGHIEAIETVDIQPRVSGYIKSINFKDGAYVNEGDLLFVIDSEKYENELARARAELLRARASLEQAKAERQRATTRLELAQNDLQRAEGLRKSRAISEEEYDLRNKTCREAQSAIEAANAAIAVWEAAIKSAEALVKTAELNLSYTQVKAPISGRIGKRYVDIGNLVQGGETVPGTKLATIVKMDPIYCYFDVDERAFLKYRNLAKMMGQKELYLPCELGLDGEEGFPHKGQIDFYDNRLNPTSGTIRMRGVFENKDGALMPGNFARIRLPVERIESAMLIPEGAILSQQTMKFVYVMDEEQVVQVRPLKLGRLQGMERVVLGGLKPDDKVVVTGLLMLRPGIKVQLAPPQGSMSAPGMPIGGAQPQGGEGKEIPQMKPGTKPPAAQQK